MTIHFSPASVRGGRKRFMNTLRRLNGCRSGFQIEFTAAFWVACSPGDRLRVGNISHGGSNRNLEECRKVRDDAVKIF